MLINLFEIVNGGGTAIGFSMPPASFIGLLEVGFSPLHQVGALWLVPMSITCVKRPVIFGPSLAIAFPGPSLSWARDPRSLVPDIERKSNPRVGGRYEEY